MTALVLGAYAAAPRDLYEDRDAERTWYEHLRREPLVGGLELAWEGALHPAGNDRLIAQLSPEWRSVVTLIPGVSARVLKDPLFGLASTVAESRAAALRDLDRAHADVSAVQDALGQHAIRAVQLQSAPGARGSAAAFALSLEYALSLDWGGALVMIEHCDDFTGPAPQKGFLPLVDEQEALRTALSATPAVAQAGYTLNWARSTIETQDPGTVNAQLKDLSRDRYPIGLMFSGVAPTSTIFGGAWADAHLPIAQGGCGAGPASLLTAGRVGEAIEAIESFAYLGAKVSAPKRDNIGLVERLDSGFTTLKAISETLRA